MSIHGFFAFGLEAVDDDEVAVGAFEHERGSGGVDAGSFTKDVSDTKDVGFENDASFVKESVFGFWIALEGDDLTVDGLRGEVGGAEEAHGFVEFGGISGGGIVLRLRGGEMGEIFE